MKNIIFIHGFNDGDEGEDNVDLLAPYARAKGYNPVTQDMDYGWRFLLGVRYRNRSSAKKLLKLYKPGDIVVGYSNGCAIIAMAIDMGLPVKHCIFIHPALDANWVAPLRVRRVDVYYSENDKTTKTAGWIKYSPLNLFSKKHYWGDMGTNGPRKRKNMYGHNDGYNHYEWKDNLSLYLSTVEDLS